MRFVPVIKTLTTEVSQKILPALGISSTDPNKGVYDGSWYGSGEVVTSVDPATNQPIAAVQTVHKLNNWNRRPWKNLKK